ncbi:MAG: type II toxin-antitoxin system RelE/ParE family toxin [Myxococcales bacterium]|nr:type II toxin-antitoxin system RelE/ParE family toxin [Myxococcales bacterium]
MTFRLLARRAAKADMHSAARWYAGQRSGLGQEFVDELDLVLRQVAENPFPFQLVHRDARRAVVHRYPYGVLYRVEEDAVVVFCVIQLHRDPTTSQSLTSK